MDTISKFLIGLAALFGFLVLNTAIHETGHIISALMFGCKISGTGAGYLTGITRFSCPFEVKDNPIAFIIIALSGPYWIFFVGNLMWHFSKTSIIRLGGLLSFWYSVVPNIYPALAGSDMNAAITQFYFNPVIAWALFIITGGYLAYLTLDAITGEKWEVLPLNRQ